MKLLYLGVRNITGRHIDGNGHVRAHRGAGTYGWKTALNHFAVVFGDRLIFFHHQLLLVGGARR